MWSPPIVRRPEGDHVGSPLQQFLLGVSAVNLFSDRSPVECPQAPFMHR
jgi:hypothetical protein